ncbi:MAG: GNAT family N-acetyltransferase [Bacteroidota bacterium]|nr:GNAT family N-acetyltransferase [Bacteroidota bacterium]
MNPDNLKIVQCDFSNPIHQKHVVRLIDSYMHDEMGGGGALPEDRKQPLVEGLAAHPACFLLFAVLDEEFVGLTTCFVNFSTFKAKPYINIHDVFVSGGQRGKGIGRKLLEAVIAIARERDYCKVTLEVRDDNDHAQKLYQSLGFRDCKPVMHFWTLTDDNFVPRD